MCALVTGVQTCALPISRRARDGEERPGLYGQRMSARRTAPQAGHGAFRRQQGSRTDRPSHRGDGEGVRPVIVGVPLLRELRTKWSRNMPRNQRIITPDDIMDLRSEEHTSELQSLMRISYHVFCLNKNNTKQINKHT